jgi:hypothetical protein
MAQAKIVSAISSAGSSVVVDAKEENDEKGGAGSYILRGGVNSLLLKLLLPHLDERDAFTTTVAVSVPHK